MNRLKHLIILITAFILMVALDYFLFNDLELVFPFFIMPYTVLALVYGYLIKKGHRDLITGEDYSGSTKLADAFFFLIIIPVFSGLIMSIAWMFKINFFGEVIGGLFR